MGGYHLKVAVSEMWRERWINLLSALSIAVGLFLIALAVLGVYNVKIVTKKLPERFSITVFLKDGLSASEVQEINRAIRKNPGVKTLTYTSKEDALKDLKATLLDSDYVMEGLEENPLPASIAVGLRRDSVTDSSVEALARKIEGLVGVSEVEYGKKLLRVIESVRKGSEFAGGFLISALSAALIFVCYSTVKILFYRKKEEIETLTLLGATRWFIRAPFLIEGGLIGLGGGVLSSLAIAAFVYAGYRKLAASVPLMGAFSMPPELLYWMPLTGLCLGVAGSLIAIGRIKF